MRLPRLIAAFLLVGAIAGPANADELADALRRDLQLPVDATIVWPPRGGLGVGSIVDTELRILATSEGATDRVATTHAPIRISIPAARLQPGSQFWLWRSLLGAPENLSATLVLTDMEIANLTPIDAAAGRAGIRTPDASRVRSSATRTVQRSWMARMAIEIAPGSGLADADWSAMRKIVLNAQTGTMRFGDNPKSIILSWPEKIAIAIEFMPDIGEGPAQLQQGRITAPKRWALATIASGRYQFLLPGMNQDWNTQSADLAAEGLRDWKPSVVRALAPTGPLGLVRDEVLSFLDKFASDANSAKAELLVVYYVGHMERTGTGSLSLLMGDAPAQRQMRAPPPASNIGNLRDVMQIVDQAEAELAPRPGTLDVAVVHRRVGRAKIPFVLLVDGCLEDPTFAEARRRLGIVVDAHGGEPVYVGPDDAGTALRTQIAQLEAYPQDFPWLKSRNATVLGATPGTVAYGQTHPTWLLGGTVGPIARKLFDVAARTRWDPQRPSLIRVLNFSADRQAVGPQELVGTVSWSDWLPLLRRFDPASFRG
ncbi:MAG: hypothetical protein QOJ15_2042 [Bradyrhizobium sp.]|nr:hypothetical protein [Bradyrhizobium sp.]